VAGLGAETFFQNKKQLKSQTDVKYQAASYGKENKKGGYVEYSDWGGFDGREGNLWGKAEWQRKSVRRGERTRGSTLPGFQKRGELGLLAFIYIVNN